MGASHTELIKVNVDAAVNKTENRIGIGVVARDIEGLVIMAASKTMWPFIGVERAELEAFYWATQLANERHWEHIIFEGDVVDAL